MIIIKPSVEIEEIDGIAMLKRIEKAGRTCYKSEKNITEDSAKSFVANLIKNGHESVIEHEKITATIICDRGCCYDDQTEVLTENGWKFFKNVQKDDRVACLDDDGNLIYHVSEKIIIKDYSGDMLAFQSSAIDLLVTPNHNMWIYDYDKRSTKTRIWKFIQADELNNGRYLFKKNGGNWTAQDTLITLPRHRTKFNSFPEIKFNYEQTNALLELLGLWITDGSYHKRQGKGNGESILITQLKQKGKKRIEELCKILNFKYRYHNNSYHIDNGRLSDFIKNLFGDGPKTFTAFVPSIIKNLSTIQIQHFLNGVILGDGNRHKKNNHVVVYTSSKQFADDLQELFFKTNLSANIRTIAPRFRKGIKNGKSFTSKISYVVSVHKTPNVLLDKRCAKTFKKKIPYTGKVYCLTVPYHRLYVRRNGKSIWCGNSHEIVRHRLASYSQESTRYVDYKNSMQFIDIQPFMNEEALNVWIETMTYVENAYNKLRKLGATPQIARSVLPNSLKTEIVMTCNLREWRHFFKVRCAKAAHPQMREVAIELLNKMKKSIPVVFDDLVF